MNEFHDKIENLEKKCLEFEDEKKKIQKDLEEYKQNHDKTMEVKG